MEVSPKSHFKLIGYLNFRFRRRVNLVLNLEKFRKFFRKISN
jgi:hypothetical protein